MANLVLGHEWTELKDNDLKKNSNDNKKETILLIGTTGVGKTSFISLFCKDATPAQNTNAQSHTKGAKLFKDDTNDKRLFLDTQGTNDSDGIDTDDIILKKAFKLLYDANITNLKVVWMVSGILNKATKELKRQALFISNLKQNYPNIWNSVLMIHSFGCLTPEMNHIQGPIAAAKEKGCKLDFKNANILKKHAFGYKCIEMYDDIKKDPYYAAIAPAFNQVTADVKKQLLNSAGFIHKPNLIKSLNDKLANIQPLTIEFIMSQCTKCGIIGDSRYVTKPCHLSKKNIHDSQLIRYHDKALHKKHLRNLSNYHPNGLQWYHSGSLKNVSYTEKSIQNQTKTIYKHPSWINVPITHPQPRRYHPQPCSKMSTANPWKKKWRHPCCLGHSGSVGCTITYDTIVVGHKTVCQSCQQGGDKQGCQKSTQTTPVSVNVTRYKNVYTCCSQMSGARGCQEKYICCHRNRSGVGCKKKWNCCGINAENNKGCVTEYICCNGKPNSVGCKQKYNCCGGDKNSKPCKIRCIKCNGLWGKSSGCTPISLA